MPGNEPDTHGALALSEATGDDDIDSGHRFLLDDLSTRLRNLATLSYETLALVGSCFSGGMFPLSLHRGESFFYSAGPGAHAITAAKANQLAWTAPGAKGTVFFSLLRAEVNRKHVDELASMTEGGVVSGADGDSDSFSDGVVTLDTVIHDVNLHLSKLKNPKSADGKFPMLNIGELLEANDTRYGAFFFLEPPSTEQPPAAAAAPSAPPPPASPPAAPRPRVAEAMAPANKSLPNAAAPSAPSVDDRASDDDRTPAAGSAKHHPERAARQWSESAATPRAGAAVPRSSEDRTSPVAMAERAPAAAEAPAPAAAAHSSPVQQYGTLPQTTGSAVLYHPELKVFKRPEFLSDPRRRPQLVERCNSIRATR